MSNHETLYESSDKSPSEDPTTFQHDFCPRVQSLGLPMYEELRKVASLCEGGEKALLDLTGCLLTLLRSLDHEIVKNERTTSKMATAKEEVDRLMTQIERLKFDREDFESKTSDLEADFDEERKRMMRKISLLERKSIEFERIIAELSNSITQNENEYRNRINEMNIRYQQLQETHRQYVERTEENLNEEPTKRSGEEVSLAAEMQEVLEDQSVEKGVFPLEDLDRSPTAEDMDGTQDDSIKTVVATDEDDPSDHPLTFNNLFTLFALTTMTILPSVFSVSLPSDITWQEIFMSAMDPFLPPHSSMPPV